jgi:hypothetical protein
VDFLDQGRVVDASGLSGINRFGLSGCNFSRVSAMGPVAILMVQKVSDWRFAKPRRRRLMSVQAGLV